MKPEQLNVDAIIEELRTTGQSKISLPQPVNRFCKAMRRITAALAPLQVYVGEKRGDATVMLLRAEKVSA